MIEAASGNRDVPGEVVGVGSALPDDLDPERFRKRHGVDGRFILYVGRIDQNKGCRVLFSFFRQYRETTGSPLKLVLVGQPILEIPRDAGIVALGFLPDQDKWDALAAADLLAMPARYEAIDGTKTVGERPVLWPTPSARSSGSVTAIERGALIRATRVPRGPGSPGSTRGYAMPGKNGRRYFDTLRLGRDRAEYWTSSSESEPDGRREHVSPRPQVIAARSYARDPEALAIQRMLRQEGFESDIFAEKVHPRMASLARPLWDYTKVSAPDTVCVFHFSIGSAAGRLVFHAPDRLVSIYHNITPAHWFLGFHPIRGACQHGEELQAFAPRTELAWATAIHRQRVWKRGTSERACFHRSDRPLQEPPSR